MSDGLEVRQYRWPDLDAVWALHQIGLAQVGLVPGDGVYYDDDFPRISEVYLANQGDFLVGEVLGPGIVAMGGLRRVDDQTAEMCRLRVHPAFQRRGYGTRIVRALEQRAGELGYSVLRGDTTLQQEAAVELYRGFGWSEIRRERRGANVVIYGEKQLTPEVLPVIDLTHNPDKALADC